MPKMITIGETMAAFTPGAGGPLRYVNDYRMRIAGAESNVAIGAAKLGIDVAWISRLGEDEFGHFICNQTRGEGVDCRYLLFDDAHPTGIMFKETGVGETRVFYYREGSAASHMTPEDLDEELFQNASLLHMTGITPILSEDCAKMTEAAFSMAEHFGLTISFDPNIRRKLWKGKDHGEMIRGFTLRSHIVLMGLDEADFLFHTKNPEEIAKTVFGQGKAQYIILKDGANGAIAMSPQQIVPLPPYPCKAIEPIGAGDGFNAGFLAGFLQGKDFLTAGRMGCICGALATQTPGDVEGYPDIRQMEAALEGSQVIYR
ncbi:MAG: sugar kinase [Blautia sp.]|jgi:2-dehydro-3-deoxygluconokinase